ncbi:hypothetical protein CASFOL_035640 [Castilleja foliolosa]|uniref:RING-type domain-containing protein n=1 Tax=Castilleja foliolosa TaxID=1961234 RepID=A0ABD3BT82_9LAMI
MVITTPWSSNTHFGPKPEPAPSRFGFGSSNSATGSTNSSIFGVPNSSTFANSFTTGTSHAFPSTTPGFGINSTKTPGFVFNSTSTSNNNNTFGVPNASAFANGFTTGTSHAFPSTTPGFGINSTKTPGFVFNSTSTSNNNNTFGIKSFTGSPGATKLKPTTGSRLSPYSATCVPAECTEKFQSISAMPVYETKSHEELRLEDYELLSNKGSSNTRCGPKPEPAPSSQSFFGFPTSSGTGTVFGFGFGSSNSATGSTNSSIFGVPNPSAFANGFTTGTSHAFPSTTPGFGINSTKTPGFVFNSTSTSNNNNTFGVPNPSAIANGFTTGTSHAFPSTTPGFGINSTKTPGFVFNSTSTSSNNNTFGVINPSAFANGFTTGTSHAFPSTTPGFGINSTKTPGFVFNSTSTSSNNNTFGVPNPSAFANGFTTGTSHAFPSTTPGFCINSTKTPGFVFNSTSTSNNNNTFGVPNPSAFTNGFTTGTSHAFPSTTPGFGISSTKTPGFVFNSTSTSNNKNKFGIKSFTGSPGATKLKPTTGSRLSPYSATCVPAECTERFQSISAMPVYETKSHEELRLEDYELLSNKESCPGIKGSSNTCFGPITEPAPSSQPSFGFPTSSGTRTLFGVPNTTGIDFKSTLGFGFNSSNSATASANSSVFDVPNPSAFATGFTTGTSHAFPSTTPGFGINSTNTSGFVFNSTSTSGNNNIFGIESFTGSPGATKLKPTNGSRLSPYSATCVPAEVNVTECIGKFQSISAMPVYQTKSHEELRLEDYELLRNHVRVYYPADKSLEKKKKKIIDCSICLDQILIGAEGLPCCHLFHKDCIKKWLKKSRYCPVCRYQL